MIRSSHLMIIAPLLAVAIIAVLYFSGGPKSYVKTVVKSKDTAAVAVESINLAGIYRALRQYAAVNDGKFPASTDELIRETGLPRKLFSPDGPGLSYIPAQNEKMPGSNVLLHETEPGPDDKCQLLRLDGRIELLSPQEVRAEVDRTQKALR
ncbi:MAG: hypothetical protein SVT52_04700 [Planctomycetota bacterium]|nr:hypothetical protein [Planctomycetota bacterium]